MRCRGNTLLHLMTGAAAIGLCGCLDDFGGSNVQFDFRPSMPINAPRGTTPAAFQPPQDTYYMLLATDQIRDDSDTVTAEYVFEVHRFEIRPFIDLTSPCQIDVEGEGDFVFPGIHLSAYPDKVREVTGLPDPTVPDADPIAVQRVLTADRRLDMVEAWQTQKVVTSSSVTEYPLVAADCTGSDPSRIPPPSCIDDASNARRLEMCRAVWAVDPLVFVGTDRVITSPIAGKQYGFVRGANPVNGSAIGGVSLFVEEVLAADAYAINWQYKDLDRDGTPDYPAAVAPDLRTAVGFSFMTGTPDFGREGVIRVDLVHAGDPNISAVMSIFSNLDHDPIQF